jgi:adenine-specific DNA-methyltransferase
MLALNAQDVFLTPKPERLLFKILQIATNQGDLILILLQGQGTTGAVAHKMGRRWIMVELGESLPYSHHPTVEEGVIDGEDDSGITEAVDGKVVADSGITTLRPSLLEKDKWGNWVINKAYNPGDAGSSGL